MRELSQLDVEDLGRPQSEAIMRANDLDTANSDDTANGDDDNARRRVAKRRARHDRAIANAFGSEKAIRILLKLSVPTHAREGARVDAAAADDDDDDDSRERALRPSRDAAEALRADGDAFGCIERETTRTLRAESGNRLRTMAAHSREREEARREVVRETRYSFRCDMLDDAETSGILNDELVEAWNSLLRENHISKDDETGDGFGARDDDDEDGDRVDCMDLDARFRAHVDACKTALEPKESLAARLKAHLVAEVDARFDDAIHEHRLEIGKARRLAAEERLTRETAVEEVISNTKTTFGETSTRRDALRSEALAATDRSAAAEDADLSARYRREADARRASLIEIKLRNASEVSELRACLEHRVSEAFSRLQYAIARAPLRAERLRDAMKRRRGNEARRRARERLASRAMNDMRFELQEMKRCYTETERANAGRDRKLRLATLKTTSRVGSIESIGAKSERGDKMNAILSMKQTRIANLRRELDAAEEDVWLRALACNRPAFAKDVSLDEKCRAFEALERALRSETRQIAA